jgi:parallel beta-helix repeat protein
MRKRVKNLALVLAITFLTSTILLLSSAAETESRAVIVPDDYATIQQAIDNAAEEDTIYVKKGVYVENPIVNKSVSLIGEDRDSTIIDVTAGLKVQSSNVTIAGFTIYNGFQGISVSANCCNIFGNKIKDVTNGIVLFGYENNITGNVFQEIGLSSAIQLNFAYRNVINKNYIDSCVEGIQIWQNSNYNTITENIIINCNDTAVNFQYSNDNVLVGNNISRSGLGTSIYGSNRNTISNNNYFDNDVQFGANESYYLTFGHNRSINTIDGNYWSDYNGTDANRNGAGDTPYVIDDNNKDDNPLMNQALIADFSMPVPSITSQSNTSLSENQLAESFPTWVIAIIAIIAVVVLSLLILLKKRRQPNEPFSILFNQD